MQYKWTLNCHDQLVKKKVKGINNGNDHLNESDSVVVKTK